jgi:hypothetical protein
MPEDDQYDRNMWHVLTILINCYVAGGSTYASVNLIVTFF